MTSAYLPLGGVMIPETMYQAMLDESRKIGTFGHGFTYSGHPVAAAVAIKTLEIYERERIFEGVRAQGAAVPAPARGARRPSARRRGPRHRPDRRRSRSSPTSARKAQFDPEGRRRREGGVASRRARA